MQNALWKVLALAGVIGVGVLVVLQAQHGLEQPPASSDDFTEVDSFEEFEPTREVADKTSLAETPATDNAAGLLTAFGSPSTTPPGTSPPAEGPVRTPVPAANAADEWQGIAGGYSSTPASQTPPAEAAEPGDNPFAGLAQLASTQTTSTPADEADQTVEEFNPFTGSLSNPAPSASAEVSATTSPEVTASAEFPQMAASDFPDSRRTLEEPARLAPEVTMDEVPIEPEFAPEPSVDELAVLPDDHPGLVLMTPPDTSSVIHAEAQTSVDETAEGTILPTAGRQAEDASALDPFATAEIPPAPPQAESPALLPSAHAFGALQVAELETTPAEEQRPVLSVLPPATAADFGSFDPAPTEPAPHPAEPTQSYEVTIQPRAPENAASVNEPEITFPGMTQREEADAGVNTQAQPDLPRVQPLGFAPTQPQPSVSWGDPSEVAPESTSPETSANLPGLPHIESRSLSQDTETAQSDSAPRVPGIGEMTFVGDGVVQEDSPDGPQQPQVSIEKSAPPQAVLGQPMIYTIQVRNVGRTRAKNVVVEDRVPLGTTLTGTDPRAEYIESDGRLMWRLGQMDSGGEKLIRVRVIPTDAGQVGSVATVSFEAEVASRTIINAPKLRFALVGPDEVRVGEQAHFRFTVSNEGSAEAAGVVVRSLIPAGFQHPGGDDLEYEVGILPHGQSREVELDLLAVAPGQFENRSVLVANGGVNLESAQPVNVLNSRLSVTRTGPENRFVGREATYSSTVTNVSRESLSGILIEETVPRGLQFKEASAPGQFVPQQQKIVWRMPRLEPGQSISLSSRFLATQEGEMQSLVRAADDRGDATELVTRTKVIGFSSLKVDVSHAGRPVAVGEEVALRLSVRNGGTAVAQQVGTWIEIPRQLRFQSAQGPVRFRERAGGIEFEPIGQLDRESEQSFDVVMIAVEAGDARVRVHLASAQLQEPISEEESIVIFAEDR